MYVLSNYTFTPNVGEYDELVIPGIFAIQQIAEIQNATRNTTLYTSQEEQHLGSVLVSDDGVQTTVLVYPADPQSKATDDIRILIYNPAPTGSGPTSNVAVTNWPASQNINGAVTINGEVEVKNDTGTPLSVSVSNFPATQPISGTVNVGNFPATQAVTGTVTANQGTSPWVTSVNNFPATQEVTQGTIPWEVSGTVITTPEAVASFDAFGRQRVAQGYTLADYSCQYGEDFSMLTEASGASSSVTYPVNNASARLTVGTGATDFIRRQSRMYHNYQPGKSQLVYCSFNFINSEVNSTKRIGYFDDRNGIYLQQAGDGTLSFVQRSYVSGGVVEVPFPQGPAWNVDPCDGTGPSGFDLDPAKTQLLYLDFQWLGVGRIRIGFIHDGQYIIALDIPHSNIYASAYWSLASLPIRAEIVNSGVLGSSTYMDMICSTVISEGGYDEVGDNFSISSAIRTIGNTNAVLPVAAIRLKNTFNGYPNRAYVRIDNLEVIAPDNSIKVQLIRLDSNAAVTGGSWVSANANSHVEYNITPTGFVPNGDQVINQFYLASGGVGGGNNVASPLNVTNPAKARRGFIAQNINSNDSMAYMVYCTSLGAGATAGVTIQWREIS